jgi:hypothetical protein
MHFQVAHKKTKTEARQKVKDALEAARPQLKGQAEIKEERWEGDTFHFVVDLQGKQVTGTLVVTDSEFVIDAKLPLLWRLFEGRIEKEIAKQVAGLK